MGCGVWGIVSVWGVVCCECVCGVWCVGSVGVWCVVSVGVEVYGNDCA